MIYTSIVALTDNRDSARALKCQQEPKILEPKILEPNNFHDPPTQIQPDLEPGFQVSELNSFLEIDQTGVQYKGAQSSKKIGKLQEIPTNGKRKEYTVYDTFSKADSGGHILTI